MKRITVDLECSHTATLNVATVPAQPNHLFVNCAACGGRNFAALRVTKVEEIEVPAPVVEAKAPVVETKSPVAETKPAK